MVLVAALAGGTAAFFTSQSAAVGNSFTAGSLDLALTQNQDGNSPSDTQTGIWELGSLAPGGEPETASVWLRNIGSIPGATLNVAVGSGWSNPSNIAAQMRIADMTLDGQNLLEGGAGATIPDYEGPDQASCDATVASGDSIQTALTAAASGDTVCVEAGTYAGALTIMTDGITLVSLDGPDDTTIDAEEATNGIAIGDTTHPGTHPDNVTVQGFTVENWDERGIAQRNGDGTIYVYDNIVADPFVGSLVRGGIIVSGGDGSEVLRNEVTTPMFGMPSWSSAAIMLNGTDNALVAHNIVAGTDIGIIIGGYPDWSGVDPSWVEARDNTIEYNDVTGADRGIALVGDIADTLVTHNHVDNSTYGIRQYEQLGGTPGAATVAENNLVDNDVAIQNDVSGTTIEAENNWWGSFDPETAGDGDVNSSNFAGGPFVGYVSGVDQNGNGYADLADLRTTGIAEITPGLDPYDGSNDKEFVLSVQLDGPTTGNSYQGLTLDDVEIEFTLGQI